MDTYTDVDEFLARTPHWRDEATKLRAILLRCGLEEAIKWAKPCYASQGRKIAIIQPMKNFLALLFFEGALLDDPEGLLQAQGPNTRAARRLCFTTPKQVTQRKTAIADFVRQAIAFEAQGKKLPKRPKLVLAKELQARLDQDPKLNAAFKALTPGRQREYNLHVSGAKRSKTRAARVEKFVARILDGKGMRDR
jgi:uncharacterized protein YdeI (YjbR/CyaY-like superfamily)